MFVRRRTLTALRIIAGVFLALHAFAHAPGILAAWKIIEYDDASFQPNVILTDASDTAVAILGAIWLVSAVAYLIAAFGLLWDQRWWPSATFVAGTISLVMTVLWMEDAVVGLVINVAVIGALAIVAAIIVSRNDGTRRAFPGSRLGV